MKKILVLSILSLTILLEAYSAGLVFRNLLSQSFYGFENGGSAWWMQHSEWGIATERTADETSYSIKYTSSMPVSEQKKAHGGYNGSEISLETGEYELRMKVWVESGSDISGFNFTLKETWINTSFAIDTVTAGQWVELRSTFTVAEAIVNSGCLLTVAPEHGGAGTMFIDEIQIWGYTLPEPVELPFISEIQTGDTNTVSLNTGYYNVGLKVYIEPGTTISTLYTQISRPYYNLSWQLDALEQGSWVELQQELLITEKVENSLLKFIVNNHPDYGGGNGTLYIDDLVFTEITDRVLVEGVSISDTAITLYKGETYQLNGAVLPANATNSAVTWHSDNEHIATVDAGGLVTAHSNGSAEISITSSEGSFYGSCKVWVVGGEQVEAFSAPEFSVYPNPAMERFYIEGTHVSSCVLFNSQGLVMLQIPKSQLRHHVNITALQRGVYVLKIKTEQGLHVRKIIIQ